MVWYYFTISWLASFNNRSSNTLSTVQDKKTIAIYPGTFDPFHVGHLDILKKAEAIFGEGNVVVYLGQNPDKDGGYKYRQHNLHEVLKNTLGHFVPVKFMYNDFLFEIAHEVEVGTGCNAVVVKGLRDGDDLKYEADQLDFKKHLDFKPLPDIKSVFIMGDPKYSLVSSSRIKKLDAFRNGCVDHLIV